VRLDLQAHTPLEATWHTLTHARNANAAMRPEILQSPAAAGLSPDKVFVAARRAGCWIFRFCLRLGTNHHASADRQQDTTTQTVTARVTATPRPTKAVRHRRQNARRPRIPQSLTVVNDKLIHDQGKDSQERARKRHRHHTLSR
jgi:hypothetical protein